MFETGLGGYINGVTHECNYPPQALKKPRVITPSVDFSKMNATQVDAKIRELSHENLPIFKNQ